MGRERKNKIYLRNRIKELTEQEGITSTLISMWADVNKATVTSWNNNDSEPSQANLNKVGELFETDNRMLFESNNRKKTGLAKALNLELKRLNQEEGIPNFVEYIDERTGKTVERNNPKIVEALRVFAEEHLKKNG